MRAILWPLDGDINFLVNGVPYYQKLVERSEQIKRQFKALTFSIHHAHYYPEPSAAILALSAAFTGFPVIPGMKNNIDTPLEHLYASPEWTNYVKAAQNAKKMFNMHAMLFEQEHAYLPMWNGLSMPDLENTSDAYSGFKSLGLRMLHWMPEVRDVLTTGSLSESISCVHALKKACNFKVISSYYGNQVPDPEDELIWQEELIKLIGKQNIHPLLWTHSNGFWGVPGYPDGGFTTYNAKLAFEMVESKDMEGFGMPIVYVSMYDIDSILDEFLELK